MKIYKYMNLKNIKVAAISLVLLITGCAEIKPVTQQNAESRSTSETIVTPQDAIPRNPMDGDRIFGPLSVGMTIPEVLAALPKSKFDDRWSSGGMGGVMAEAGIVAGNKIKVTVEIEGPFKSTSTLFALFDDAGRLDGVVISTRKKDWPAAITANFGTLGYFLPEFKDAVKKIIKYGIPELGVRVGAPKMGKEQPVSLGSIGVGNVIGGNKMIGVGLNMGTIGPASIVQMYKRDGYKSFLSIRAIYLSNYAVYSATNVFMVIQAKSTGDDEIPDFE